MSDSPPEEAQALLASAAWELYAVPPEGFVAARTARVKELRGSGHRDVAKEVAVLRRPSVSAAAVNALVRAGDPAVATLVDVGTRLRHAQSALDAAGLAGLRGERDAALAAWVEAAGRAAGGSLSPSVADEVRSTAVAALADEAATEAVTSGTLTRSLAYSGFGEVDLADAVARTRTGVVLTRIEGGAGMASSSDGGAADDEEQLAEAEEVEAAGAGGAEDGEDHDGAEAEGQDGDEAEDDDGAEDTEDAEGEDAAVEEDEADDAGPPGPGDQDAPDLEALRAELSAAEDLVTRIRSTRKEAAGALSAAEEEEEVTAQGVAQARRLLAQAERHAARAAEARADAERALAAADEKLRQARDRRDEAREALEEAEDA